MKIYICKPEKDKLLFPKPFNYEKLKENGFIPTNTKIDDNDIIIGKVMPLKNNLEYNYKDCSVPVRNNESGYIDGNYVNYNAEGYRFL